MHPSVDLPTIISETRAISLSISLPSSHKHVSSLYRSAYHHLRDTYHISVDQPTIISETRAISLWTSLPSSQKHVPTLCRSAYHHLRNTGNIQNSLDKETRQMLVHTFVTSRLDSYNAVLADLPQQHMCHKPQPLDVYSAPRDPSASTTTLSASESANQIHDSTADLEGIILHGVSPSTDALCSKMASEVT